MKSLKNLIFICLAAVTFSLLSCDREDSNLQVFSTSTTSLNIGDTKTWTVPSGNGPFEVWNVAPGVATVTADGNIITIVGKSAGTATVNVVGTDKVMSRLVVTVTAGGAPTLSPSSVELLAVDGKNTATVTITKSVAPYRLSALSADQQKIATVALAGDKITVTGKSWGSVSVTVTGANGGASTLSIAVRNQVTIVSFAAGALADSVQKMTKANPNNFDGLMIFTGNSPLSTADYTYLRGLPARFDFSGYTFESNAIPASALGLGKMREIIFPASLQTVNDFAITKCTSLSKITDLPGTINGGVWGQVLFGSTALGSYSIGEGATATVGTFDGCTNITAVTLPTTITSIGARTLGDCAKMKTLTVKADVPPTLDPNAFVGTVNATFTDIKVPAASVDAYKAAPVWSTYAAKIKAI